MFLTQQLTILIAANVIIALCYYAISIFIGVGLWQQRSLGFNKLGTATAGIFLTCASGHAVHAYHFLTMPWMWADHPGLWSMIVADGLTIIPAVTYVALRQRYGLLIRGPHAILDFQHRIEDLEHIKRENEQLIAELQQANAIKDQFLSVAAHELKTPLTSIKGFSELVAMNVEKSASVSSPDELAALHNRARRSLTILQRQTTKMTRLVEQLLDVSRIDTGRLAIETYQTDVAALSREVVEQAGAWASGHTITVEVQGDCTAEVDPLRLEQVLANVVDNAIKYSPDGGPVSVTVRARTAEAIVEISVRDQGVGVPMDRQDRVFDRFYQAREQDKHTAGLGLGLFICKEIVELHQGSIALFSPPEGGTQVTIRLPVVGPLSEVA